MFTYPWSCIRSSDQSSLIDHFISGVKSEMTSKSSPTFVSEAQNFQSGDIIKFLNDEFDKFEKQAKNCDRYTILDLRLPVRIIELFLKLFKLCVDNPILRHNIDSVELFMEIFLLMRTHFKTQYSCSLGVDYDFEEYLNNDEDSEDNYKDCDESNPFRRFLNYISYQEGQYIRRLNNAFYENLLKNSKHVESWFREQNGVLMCEICNFKCTKCNELEIHSKLPSHERNLDIFKDNESYAAFPDTKVESFGCKACKSEYSTYNSLVKHFDKPQHRNEIRKIQVAVTASPKSDICTKDKAKTTTNDISETPSSVRIKTEMNNLSKEKKCDVAKKISNAASDVVNKISNSNIDKSQMKKATKTEMKSAGNVLTTKNTIESKSPVDTSSKSKTESSKTAKLKTASDTSSTNKNPPLKVETETKNTAKPEYSLKFIVTRDSSGKYCQICDRNLPNEDAILSHVKGSDHMKMMSVFELNQEFVKTSINCDDFVCILCCDHCSNIHELTCHFKGKKHKASMKVTLASPLSQPLCKPVQKSAAKINFRSIQLSDTDKKFLHQKGNLIQCVVCDVTLEIIDNITEHINNKQHSQNVTNFTKHEEYVKLPSDKAGSFNCLKCTLAFDSFIDILTHCKEHINITLKTKPAELFKLKKSNEKFISKGKTEKSLKCTLCDKELPTDAAVISHTGSTNHVKNCNVFIKNETFCVANKMCSLCDNNCHDLAALVKHFKTDTHQKIAVKGKKSQDKTIHIPSYAKPKLDQIVTIPTQVDSPKLSMSKKNKKTEETATRKSKFQMFSMADLNLDEFISCERFSWKNPDNSYIIAKNDVFYCRICDVDLQAAAVAAHQNGATHRINAEVFESLQCYVLLTSESDSVKCTMCKLTFDQVHQLIKHFRDKLHVKPLNPKNANSSLESSFCDMSQNNPATMETSLATDSTLATVAEIKRDEKSCLILKSDRKHIIRLGGTLVQCNLCNTKLADNDALESHVNNLNHKRNSTVYQENEPLIKQLDNVGSSFECISCSFCGDLNKVIKHCKKKQHLLAKGCCVEHISDDEMLDEDCKVDPFITEFDFKCITMKNGIVRCKICHSKLTGEKNLLQHMKSPHHKHSSVVYKLNEPFIEQFDELELSYKCIICEVIFTRLDTMIRHFSEDGHLQINTAVETKVSNDDIVTVVDVRTADFECYLCSETFNGFAALSKHCNLPQHEILKNTIQSEQNEMPYNISIVDYLYYCNACNIYLSNKALMEKHQNKRIHKDAVKFYRERRNLEEDPRPNIIEIIGYEYLCNLCWVSMYTSEELENHERSNTHKSGKNFDDVWRFNERHLIMCQNMYKVRCKLCEKTIGIEKLIKHCTSRNHRLKFITNCAEESAQDPHIIWRNASQYCTLCDCKLINNHNLANHVNSTKHKLKLMKN